MSNLKDATCPICQMPREKSSTGTITQWVSVCQCEADKFALASRDPLVLCKNCGKRAEEGRPGSITQWIFRASRCTCDQPELSVVAQNSAQTQVKPKETKPVLSAEERAELPNGFPRERYQPLKLLGKGATGRVYMCEDVLLMKIVAVKTLHVLSSDLLVAFQREAKATNRLNHSGIVKVLDFGVQNDTPYMVLECINGISLASVLEQGPISVSDALDLFSIVADALQHAHQVGVFHRDLKPSNILLVDGHFTDARIIDFGVAHLIGASQESAVAQSTTIAGTPAYMSPDQIDGRAYDARSEVYSFGCVLFEALTGRKLFDAESALEVMAMHMREPPPVELLNTGIVDARLRKLVEKCLKKSPDQRFSSFKDLSAELAACGLTAPEASELHNAANLKGPSKKLSKKLLLVAFATLIALPGLMDFFQWQRKPVPPRAKRMHESPLPAPSATNIDNSIKRNETKFVFLDDIDDNGLIGFEKYHHAEDISLSGQIGITDKGLYHLRNQKHLRVLSLEYTSVKDLSALKNLSNLAVLNLRFTKINDDSLQALESLTNLRMLDLRDTAITNRGLKRLIKLPSLERVSFTPSADLDEAVEVDRLSQANPKCIWLKQSAQERLSKDQIKASTGDFEPPLQHVERLIEVSEAQKRFDRAYVENLTVASRYSTNLGDKKKGQAYMNRAIECARSHGYDDQLKTLCVTATADAIKAKNLVEAERLTMLLLSVKKLAPGEQRTASHNLADAFTTSGQTQKELKWWREFVRYSPDDLMARAHGHFYLGNTLVRLKKYDEGLREYDLSIRDLDKLGTNLILTSTVLLVAGDLELKLHRKESARKRFLRLRDFGEVTNDMIVKLHCRRVAIGRLLQVDDVKSAEACTRNLLEKLGDTDEERQVKAEGCVAMIAYGREKKIRTLEEYWRNKLIPLIDHRFPETVALNSAAIGQLQALNNDRVNARRNLKAAARMFDKMKHCRKEILGEVIGTYHVLSGMLASDGDIQEAMEENRKGLDLLEHSGGPAEFKQTLLKQKAELSRLRQRKVTSG